MTILIKKKFIIKRGFESIKKHNFHFFLKFFGNLSAKTKIFFYYFFASTNTFLASVFSIFSVFLILLLSYLLKKLFFSFCFIAPLCFCYTFFKTYLHFKLF